MLKRTEIAKATNPGSLVSSLGKSNIHLHDGLFLSNVDGRVILLAEAEIVAFDLIGALVEFDSELVFIPWGNIAYIEPLEVDIASEEPAKIMKGEK
jgi:hypothetical protein